jgi:lysophospholipase L1-like esterase
VLGASAARWLFLLAGVNDIGIDNPGVPASIIEAFERCIAAAHARRMLVYGSPILPFGGSSYDTETHESARQAVNSWIRASGKLDAVDDLAAAVHDPTTPTRLEASYDSGDHLHLSPAGYQRMAEAVDLSLFTK